MPYKLRMKFADAEFESEGEEQSVYRGFESFKDLLASSVFHGNKSPGPAVSTTNGAALGGSQEGNSADIERLKFLYAYDDDKGLVSLRFLPQGEDRVSTAMLLVLYGYRRFVGTDEVRVTQLKTSLVQSGLPVNRIDKDAALQLLAENLIFKGGRAKGARYKLTNAGQTTAEEEIRKLMHQT